MAVPKALRRSKWGLAGLAAVGLAGIASLLAGWNAGSIEPAELSPADIVTLRFPPDWNDVTASTGPAGFAAARGVEQPPTELSLLFSPYPMYAPASAQSDIRPSPLPEPAPEPAPAPANPAAEKTTQPGTTAAGPGNMALAPKRRASPASPPGALFNGAQIASIKSRLKLTSEQEQYWPPVESALRSIAARRTRDGAVKKASASERRPATLDVGSAEVQRLKSAAVPLIMSLREEQKREVRTLARVMGLDSVASQF